MTQKETLTLKGIAVLMLVYCHMNWQHPSCINFINLEGKPLAHIIGGLVAPVPMFLILGGIGLYYVYNGQADANRYRRIRKLFVHMWVVTAIFLAVALLTHHQELFPRTWSEWGYNISGLCTARWNKTYWFLFPYAIISSVYPLIFKIMDKFKAWKVITFGFCLYCIGYLTMSKYAHGEPWIEENPWISLPFQLMEMIFSFLLGALMIRENIVQRIKNKLKNNWVPPLLLTVLCIAKCLCPIGAVAPLYAFLFVILFLLCPTIHACNTTMAFLGKHSLNIWLIHGWLIITLFPDYFYSLHYPVIIFASLIGTCCIMSFIINKITTKC